MCEDVLFLKNTLEHVYYINELKDDNVCEPVVAAEEPLISNLVA